MPELNMIPLSGPMFFAGGRKLFVLYAGIIHCIEQVFHVIEGYGAWIRFFPAWMQEVAGRTS